MSQVPVIAPQGGTCWLAFGERKIIPQSFRRALICKFSRPKYRFLQLLYKSKMAFVESSTKTGWLLLKALRKQDGFRWKLYESKMAFVESWKQDGFWSKPFKKRVNRDNTKFRDKIAYMLGVLPFVEDPDLSVSAARATSGTLTKCKICFTHSWSYFSTKNGG